MNYQGLFYSLIRSWQFWGISAVVLLVGYYLSYRAALLKSKHDFSSPIIFQLIGALAILPLMYFFNQPLPFIGLDKTIDWLPLMMFLMAGLFYAVHDRAQGTVRKNVDVAVSGVIDLSNQVFLILFGLLLLGDEVNIQVILGMLLIMVANFNVAYDFRTHKINKYWSLGIIANIMLAIGISVDMNLSSGKNLPIYLSINYLWVAFLILVLTSLFNKWSIKNTFSKVLSDFNKSNWYVHLLSGFFSIYEFFSMYMAFRYGAVSVISALISSAVVFNTILAAVIFKERDMLAMKIIASIVGVIGIILLIVDV